VLHNMYPWLLMEYILVCVSALLPSASASTMLMRCTFSALSTGSRHDRRAKTELQDYVNGTQLLWISNSAETLQASFCLLQPPSFASHSRTALLSSQSTPICTVSYWMLRARKPLCLN